MYSQEVHSCFDLIHNNDNTFTVKASKKIYYRGDLKTAVKILVNIFYLDIEQIECAIEQMEINDHNRAHFGGYGKFIFTKEEYDSTGAA